MEVVSLHLHGQGPQNLAGALSSQLKTGVPEITGTCESRNVEPLLVTHLTLSDVFQPQKVLARPLHMADWGLHVGRAESHLLHGPSVPLPHPSTRWYKGQRLLQIARGARPRIL
jgi:hypothetical protein